MFRNILERTMSYAFENLGVRSDHYRVRSYARTPIFRALGANNDFSVLKQYAYCHFSDIGEGVKNEVIFEWPLNKNKIRTF